MATRRSSSLLLALFGLLLLSPRAASGQGKCIYVDGGSSPVWASVEAGLGFSSPLPLASEMKVDPAAFAWSLGASAQFQNQMSATVMVSAKEFGGRKSTFSHVSYLDLLLRVAYPLLSFPSVDWHLFILGGLSNVDKQYLEVKVDAAGQPIYVLDPVTQMAVPQGKKVTQNLWAPVFGGGTRVTYYPIDAVGLFLDISSAYASFRNFNVNEGSATVQFLFGSLVQF